MAQSGWLALGIAVGVSIALAGLYLLAVTGVLARPAG